jgi:phage terminase large subunit-like protein
LSNDFRAVLYSSWYRDLFPHTRVGKYKDSEGEIELTRKPLDAQSVQKRTAVNQWYTNTLYSRLDNKLIGAIIIVMQRVHMEDLTGFVLEHPDEWEVLSLPAIADVDQAIPLTYGGTYERKLGEVLSPERESLAVLEITRQKLGSWEFFAQYQQSPVPPGGAMVKGQWIKRYDELPIDRVSVIVVQSWDTASKGGPDNDWSVCTTWEVRGEVHHLVDVYRERVDYPTLKRKVVELAQRFDADQVLIEEAGTAIALIAELQYEVRGLTAVRHERDKQTRMSIASAKFESGNVFLPSRGGSPTSKLNYSPFPAAGTTIKSTRSARCSITTIQQGCLRGSPKTCPSSTRA